MREKLGNPSLVHEQPTWPEDPCDFGQREPRPFGPAAYVVAGAEVDDEVDARRLDGYAPNGTLNHRRTHARRAHASLGEPDEHRIDIEAEQR